MAKGHSVKSDGQFKPISFKVKDRTGQRCGRLTVIGYAGPDEVGNARWHCRCDCGNVTIVRVKALKTGNTLSCGCLKQEALLARAVTHGHSRVGKRSPEYRSWASMRSRCTNPNNSDFHHYGGRGITVCERWLNSFEEFLADMGPRPSKRHWIDRIDNNQGYGPENCRWATIEEQQRNKRSNTLITCRGRTQTMQEWCNETGIDPSLLCQRLGRLGWPIDEALGFAPHIHRATKLTDTERKLHRQARVAVNHAIAIGQLPRVETMLCGICGEQAEHYHHHKGYDPANHLDVVPLCVKCHGKN